VSLRGVGYHQQKLHGSLNRAAFLAGDMALRYPDFLRIFVIDETLAQERSRQAQL